MSGYCSIRFQRHLKDQEYKDEEQRLKEKLDSPYFDARVFNMPTLTSVVENVTWRQSDVKSNSRMNLGFANFPAKELHKMSPSDVVKKLREEKQIEWRDMPGHYKWGACLKKVLISREGYNPLTNEKVTVTRPVYAQMAFDLEKHSSDDVIQLLFAKHATDLPAWKEGWELVYPDQANFSELDPVQVRKDALEFVHRLVLEKKLPAEIEEKAAAITDGNRLFGFLKMFENLRTQEPALITSIKAFFVEKKKKLPNADPNKN